MRKNPCVAPQGGLLFAEWPSRALSQKEEWRLEPSRQYGIDLDAKLLVTTKRGHAMPKDIEQLRGKHAVLSKLMASPTT